MSSQRSLEVDVCVVGAGIMGLCAAWHLTRRGLRVICLERGSPSREATGATAGTLAVQNKQLAVVSLVVRAIAMWQQLSSEIDFDVEYERRGGLRVAHTADEVTRLEALTKAHRIEGAPLELVYPPQLFRLAPYLSRDIRAASYCADDGMANPFAAARGLLRACRDAGVRFELNSAVTSIQEHKDGTVLVGASGLTVACGSAVIAAGAWIPQLLQSLNVELPITTRVQQVLITDSGPPVFPHVVTHVDERLTLKQQRVTGKVLVGGGWPGGGERDSGERHLIRQSIRGNADEAIRVIPALAGARLLRAWTGFEGRTPDRLPIIGPVRKGSSLHVLGCASGGFTLAPVCGLLVAQTIAGEAPAISYDEFRVTRFLKRPAAETEPIAASAAFRS